MLRAGVWWCCDNASTSASVDDCVSCIDDDDDDDDDSGADADAGRGRAPAAARGGVRVADRLFETLDPTARAMRLPALRASAVVVDTVGFVSELPLELVAAFRATLEEVAEADVLVHVADATAPCRAAQRATVVGTLRAIGVPDDRLARMLEVRNKADALGGGDGGAAPAADAEELERGGGRGRVLSTSARTGAGIDDLVGAVEEALRGYPFPGRW